MPDKSNRTTTGMPVPRSFRRLLGYETGHWREGYAEIRMAITADHMNRMGKVHGGVYATLLDAAMGHCTTWCPVPGNTRKCVTVSLTTSFLQGVDTGVLTAIGQLQSVNGRIATATGEIRSETGLLCAVGQASFSYAPGSEHLTGVPKTSAPK
jgi:uncharacterized protein (TIGR00369 family)